MKAAADMSHARTKTLRPCAHCATDHPMLKIQKYCSEACRQAGQRVRNKEKVTHDSTD